MTTSNGFTLAATRAHLCERAAAVEQNPRRTTATAPSTVAQDLLQRIERDDQ